MYPPLLRLPALGAISLLLLLGSGCTSVPQKEFNSYRDAFSEVMSETEKLLVEYDAAKRSEAKRKAVKAPAVTGGARFPASVNLSLSGTNTLTTDPVDVRRQALEVVSEFNDVLILLAEGKSVEEVRSGVDALIGSYGKLSELLGVANTIPYAGPIAALASTVIAKLEQANNHRQFEVALREGEPIIRDILSLFAKDAETIYGIRAAQADRIWTREQRTVATLVRQMRSVAGEHAAPDNPADAKKLTKIEEGVRKILDRAGLQKNTEKLKTNGQRPFGKLMLSQLEQTLVQAEQAAGKYEAVIREQQALYELMASYGVLLSQTNYSLVAVRASLDSPPDIYAQANSLIAIVFAVKRDWEALTDARRATAGS
jgi:hypothetical protein